LEAALRGKRIELIDLAPKDVRTEFETKSSPIRGEQASQLQHVTGGVLAWFILAAEIACGRRPPDLDHEVELARLEEVVKGGLEATVELRVSRFVAEGLLKSQKEANRQAMLDRADRLESFAKVALSLASEMREMLPQHTEESGD